MENSKFETPKIPKSGVELVTFNRLRKRWEVKGRMPDKTTKYLGSFKDLNAAISFQKEFYS